MGIFDAEDTKAARGLLGTALVFVVTLGIVAISGAGVIGLAVRVFQLTSG